MKSECIRIIHVITGLEDGGAESVLFRLCTHDRCDHHVVVSLIDEGKYGLLLRDAGIAVHCLRMNRGRLSVPGLFKLWRLIRQSRPDVVQTWMYHADLLGGLTARLAGIKAVVWGIRNSNLVVGRSSRTTILASKMCALLSSWIPARIIVCANRAAQVHADIGYNVNKMVVVPNGCDTTRFVPNSQSRYRLRREWGVEDHMALIGMVARFDLQKDHANLFAALHLVNQSDSFYKCILVGVAMDEANVDLMDLIEKARLKGNVILLGSQTDIPAIMNALDLHVLSSAYGEAFPNVIAEAMACGTPCITTDVGDSECVVGDTGWIVPPGNAQALADSILIALNTYRNNLLFQSRKQAARKRIVDFYGIDRMIESYRMIWTEVVDHARQ